MWQILNCEANIFIEVKNLIEGGVHVYTMHLGEKVHQLEGVKLLVGTMEEGTNNPLKIVG